MNENQISWWKWKFPTVGYTYTGFHNLGANFDDVDGIIITSAAVGIGVNKGGVFPSLRKASVIKIDVTLLELCWINWKDKSTVRNDCVATSLPPNPSNRFLPLEAVPSLYPAWWDFRARLLRFRISSCNQVKISGRQGVSFLCHSYEESWIFRTEDTVTLPCLCKNMTRTLKICWFHKWSSSKVFLPEFRGLSGRERRHARERSSFHLRPHRGFGIPEYFVRHLLRRRYPSRGTKNSSWTSEGRLGGQRFLP